MSVICVGRDGVARLEIERARCAAILGRAVPPRDVSPHIHAAPARGPAVSEIPLKTEMTPSGPRVVRSAPGGFNRIRIGDAFDVMEEQRRRAHRVGNFSPQFTVGQIAAGREYAALVERVNASGVKCSSLETIGGGSGDGLTVSEAVSRDMQRLRVLRRRIGNGLAKDSLRPSKGGGRSAIRVIDLVDQVCSGGRTLTGVLERHGWGGSNQKVRAAMVGALAGALDRMQGFDLMGVKKEA